MLQYFTWNYCRCIINVVCGFTTMLNFGCANYKSRYFMPYFNHTYFIFYSGICHDIF